MGLALLVLLVSASTSVLRGESGAAIFNVKDFGATGVKDQFAQPAIQKAVDACAKAGGGTVYLPAGEYTSGTIHLRSHIRFFIDAGATLYATRDGSHYDAPSLLYGKDLENLTIEGRGTIDGQAKYEWRENNFDDA